MDKEFFLLLMIIDENESPYLETNIDTFCSNASEVDVSDDDFKESNRMHGIIIPTKGRLYSDQCHHIRLCVQMFVCP